MKPRLDAWGAVLLLGIAIGLGAWPWRNRGEFRGPMKLPDGSTLEIREVHWGTNYTYTHWGGNRLQQWTARLLPRALRDKWMPLGHATISTGSQPETNLFITTVQRNPNASGSTADTTRLVVFDDQGNVFDAAWGGSTIGMPAETAVGRQVAAFPRRAPFLGARMLGVDPSGQWRPVATFRIRNPVYGVYPQWTAESLPANRMLDDLEVTLTDFQSGLLGDFRESAGKPEDLPHRTRLTLTFQEQGHPVSKWRVQTLTLSDATGNRWTPYLVRQPEGLSWTTNGTVELLGALWPGENAWQLDIELTRQSGFHQDEPWEVPAVPLPIRGQLEEVNQVLERDGTTVQLVALLRGNPQGPPRPYPLDRLGWLAKWWGEDPDHVVALAINMDPPPRPARLSLVAAKDREGHLLPLLEHRNPDGSMQVFFLRITNGVTAVQPTFVLQRSCSVQFTARPAQVRATTPKTPEQGRSFPER